MQNKIGEFVNDVKDVEADDEHDADGADMMTEAAAHGFSISSVENMSIPLTC